MKRRSFIKAVLGLAAATQLPAVKAIGGGSSNIKPGIIGVDLANKPDVIVITRIDYDENGGITAIRKEPMTATEVLDRREEYAKAGAKRLAEVFNGEFERGFFKEVQPKLVGPVECNGRMWYAQGQEIWSTDLPVLDDYDSRTRTMRYGEDILVAHPDYPPRIFNKKGEYLKELIPSAGFFND